VRRYEDGLCIEAEVVKLLREQVETDLSSSAELFRSLARLSLDLTAVGRHDEALCVGEERVELCRRAAATCSTPSDDLASSLHSPGLLLHELGRKEDTLLACEEAVKLRRNLQETDTVPVLSLANSLENMGVPLRALSRHKESVSMAQEAVDLQRRLIATGPDLTDFLTHSPRTLIMGSFAHSLENLPFSLSAVGNAEDVVRAAGESVDIYRSVPDRTAGLEAGLVNALSSLAASSAQ
jgi:tetratricopeptide (TPR) repeat protein